MATAYWSRSATPARASPKRSAAASSSRSTPPSRSARAPVSDWTSAGGSSCSATAATSASPRRQATAASRSCCQRAVHPPNSVGAAAPAVSQQVRAPPYCKLRPGGCADPWVAPSCGSHGAQYGCVLTGATLEAIAGALTACLPHTVLPIQPLLSCRLPDRRSHQRPRTVGVAPSFLPASMNGRRLPGRGGEDGSGLLQNLDISAEPAVFAAQLR